MAEQQSSVRSSYVARDASPDSVILTPESKFSSASASADRSSSASESLSSELSLRLAGCENEIRISNEPITVANPRKVDQLKVQKEENDPAHKEDQNKLVDSARNSFSLALKDCQDRRTRLLKFPMTSLDLNNVSSSSPRVETMKKSSVVTRISGTFPSPGTPNCHNQSSAVMYNGVKRQQRQGNGAAGVLLPCNYGKILPSKWEDAERWIFSPVSGDSHSGVVRQSIVHPQRRPKSKSGPLGPPAGTSYNYLCSPSVYIFDGGDFNSGSPFSANGLDIHSCSHGGGFAVRADPCMARSVSVHGCSEAVTSPSLPSRDADENLETVKDAATDSSPTVSRRDMATQMSPHGSTRSSKESASFSLPTRSALSIMELQGNNSSKSEVRDVQIDERVIMTSWSKKHGDGNTGNSSEIVDYWRKGAADTRTLTWDVTETANCISQTNREEAKITAWENLQKAKAEAAIRKLEMKLEKKRSSSMDKIMNKLRSAQKRAQEMRHSMLSNQAHQVTRTSHKAISFCRARQMGSLSGCFTCHAL